MLVVATEGSVTLSARECDQGLKTSIAALLLALLIWLLSGCASQSDALQRLCVATDQAGKNLTEANRLLTQNYWRDIETLWRVKCTQTDEDALRVCKHFAIEQIRTQYVDRYDAARRVSFSQNLLAESVEKACK